LALRFYAAPSQIQGFFGTVLGIFGVAFVRAVLCRQRIGHEWTAHLR